MGLPLFVNINHPREEVDLWHVQQPELEKAARGQGYIHIKELRNIVSSHEDLLEALEAAKGAGEWMAGATDSDPEDHELLELVNKAIAKARRRTT